VNSGAEEHERVSDIGRREAISLNTTGLFPTRGQIPHNSSHYESERDDDSSRFERSRRVVAGPELWHGFC